MAREHDPSSHIPPSSGTSSGASGASGSSPVSVRRAVPMQGAAGDPGDALTPGGLRGRAGSSSPAAAPDAATQGPTSESTRSGSTTSASPTGGGSGNETAEGAAARTRSAERASNAGASTAASGTGAARGIGAPEPSAEGTPGPASADSAETTVTSRSSVSASDRAAASAATGAVGGTPAAAVAAAGSGGAGAGTHADGEPPGSRPKKPMLAAAAIIGAILVSVPFLVAGQDDRKPEKERTQNAAGTVLNTEASAHPQTYTSKSPTPSVTPSKEKEKEKPKQVRTEKPSEPPPSEPVVVPPPVKPERKPTATVTAKAPPYTAASALSSLAKGDPGGRHICYRAFVSGSGWQAPVCDGTMAGTAGQGKRITALNIAVWNVGGSSANAMLHDSGSTSGNAKWAPSWTAVIEDGKNNYIGSSKPGAPFMTAFAMNVGKGSVCHTAKMNNGGWGPQYCKNSRPEFMFVGTTGNNNWFEAVKLTV
ncbi:hydrogenase expression protein HypA [Streptomyces griseus]|uniref:hydrogenase expression protein HypA n=1 Tax=Streptomyces griseus TaxID=1911 RepID=UPI00083FE604|nr:hydrogenase expression protein HypA [Streptomyces griseus]